MAIAMACLLIRPIHANRNVGVPALKDQLDSGYEFVGWAKEAKKNPTIFDFNTAGTTATQTTYTIYLVAKKTNPTPTYMYYLYYKYNDGTNKYMAHGSNGSAHNGDYLHV